MAKDNKNGLEDPSKRRFLQGAAVAAGATATTGNPVGLVTSASKVAVSDVKLFDKYLKGLVKEGVERIFSTADRRESIRANIKGAGNWDFYKKIEGNPNPPHDGKIDFCSQRDILKRLEGLPDDVSLMDLLGDDNLAYMYPDLGCPEARLAKDFHELLKPLCDTHTTSKDLIRSFHGFFQKLAEHAIQDPDSFVLYGKEDSFLYASEPNEITIQVDQIKSLRNVLKGFKEKYGIETPALDQLEKVNEEAVKKVQRVYFEKMKRRDDERKKANEAEEAKREEERRQREEADKKDAEAAKNKSKRNPSSRSKRAVSLRYVFPSPRYAGFHRFTLLENNDKNLPVPTRIDWFHWLQSTNPDARPHHIRLEDDGRTILLEDTAPNAAGLSRIFSKKHSDGTCGAVLLNRRHNVDIRQEAEYAEQPVPALHIGIKTSLTLNAETSVISASDILNPQNDLAMYFGEVSKFAKLTDPLTGLHTPRGVREALKAAQQEAPGNDGKPNGLVMVKLNIEQFKAFTEQYGHQAGDIILKEIAHRLRDKFEYKSLIIGRIGGNELVLLSSVPRQGANNITDEIEQLFKNKAPMIVGSPDGQLDSVDVRVHPVASSDQSKILEFPKQRPLGTLQLAA